MTLTANVVAPGDHPGRADRAGRPGAARPASAVTRPLTGDEYVESLPHAQIASGLIDGYKAFAEQCLEKCDLDGWTVPDLWPSIGAAGRPESASP